MLLAACEYIAAAMVAAGHPVTRSHNRRNDMNAKVILLSLALVAAAAGQAPPPPAGWLPSGRLLLVPARQVAQPPPAETNATPSSESDEKESAQLLDQGEYYVLLEDGRLQMVKYTAAPLKEDKPAAQQQREQPQAQEPRPFHYVQAAQQPAAPTAPAKLQVEYVQFPLPGSQFAQTKLQVTEDTEATQEEADEEEVSGFEARLQYRDVKPITAPVYAYNPAPLVRILKK